MNKEVKFYFQFKPNIYQSPQKPVTVRDVVDLSGPVDITESILNTIIIPSYNNSAVVITAMDIIRIIQSFQPDAQIFLVGEGKTLIYPSQIQSYSKNKIYNWIKLFVSAIITFIGAGLAIMYFHADVNMADVHKAIFSIVTGKENNHPYIISIPYSIGIGVGIALFFDVFSIGKKKRKPGPLELELYNYENDIYSYIRDEEEKEKEGSL